MDSILIAIIVILCQYPLAILSLIKLFRTNISKNSMIAWNVFIIVIPFIGAASFWIYYAIKGRKLTRKESVSEINNTTTDTQTSDIKNNDVIEK